MVIIKKPALAMPIFGNNFAEDNNKKKGLNWQYLCRFLVIIEKSASLMSIFWKEKTEYLMPNSAFEKKNRRYPCQFLLKMV